jgi:hypothetical protein
MTNAQNKIDRKKELIKKLKQEIAQDTSDLVEKKKLVSAKNQRAARFLALFNRYGAIIIAILIVIILMVIVIIVINPAEKRAQKQDALKYEQAQILASSLSAFVQEQQFYYPWNIKNNHFDTGPEYIELRFNSDTAGWDWLETLVDAGKLDASLVGYFKENSDIFSLYKDLGFASPAYVCFTPKGKVLKQQAATACHDQTAANINDIEICATKDGVLPPKGVNNLICLGSSLK